MTGADIVRAREALGWTRQRLADVSGVPYARLCSLERYSPISRGRGFRTGEEAAVRQALGGALTTLMPVRGREVPTVAATAVRTTTWAGLEQGALVKVARGDGDVCAFGFHVVTSQEEYVEAYSTFNGRARCLRPEQVLTKTKRGWKQVLAK